MGMPMLLFQKLRIDIDVVYHLISMVFLQRFLRYSCIVKSKHIWTVCVGTNKFSADKALASRNNLICHDFVCH
jgi:hypothetical protein